MFHVAFPRGQGPVYEDLPPTLQPCAVAHAAPHTDRVRTAALSGLIYLLLGGGLAAVAALAPPVVAMPSPPVTHGRTIIFDGPVLRPLIQQVLPQARGGNATTSSPGFTANPAPQPDPTSAPGGLSTEDHHDEVPLETGSPTGSPTSNLGPGIATGPAGPVAREYSTSSLAVLRQVEPVYPAFARQARIQGPVVLKMTVDERGQPIQVDVLEGHPVFHEAARQAARQWRFEPARVDGQPVIATFKLTLKFSLR